MTAGLPRAAPHDSSGEISRPIRDLAPEFRPDSLEPVDDNFCSGARNDVETEKEIVKEMV